MRKTTLFDKSKLFSKLHEVKEIKQELSLDDKNKLDMMEYSIITDEHPLDELIRMTKELIRQLKINQILKSTK